MATARTSEPRTPRQSRKKPAKPPVEGRALREANTPIGVLGVTRALRAGALDAARAQGAQVVEGYPHDTAGSSATHRGTSHVFRALGFERRGTRWSCDVGSGAKG